MRLFITFKKNTSHYDKVLVMQDLPRNIAWDLAVKHYGTNVDTVYTEQELASILPQRYECKEHWVIFGEKVTGIANEVSVESITDWFRIAKPEPLSGFPSKWVNTQLGVHFEEVAEMLDVLKNQNSNLDLAELAFRANVALVQLSQYLYQSDVKINLNQKEKIELLDSLTDQVVTATGIAYFSKFKFDEALTEVNQSNYSKFENDKPVLNENGKIIKGKYYFKPNLTQFV